MSDRLDLKVDKRRNLALRDASIDLPHLPLTGHSGNPCILRDGGAAVGGRPNDNPAVAEAFARAAHVTRLELRSNRIVVNPIEPRAALAEYDPARRHFALHVGCQDVFGFLNYIAGVLGVGRDEVRIITDRVGGSFGAHHLLPNQATHTAMA